MAEVKDRADGSGFKTITKWMGEPPVDVLFCIEDRKDPLVVLRWETYREIVEALRG